MRGKQTTLDLNGPILSFIQQPVGVSSAGVGVGSTGGGTVTFVGIATATFTTVDGTPTNLATNTGSIAYQWYEEGVGALSDSTYVTGTATTTFTLLNLTTPTDNQRKFYLEADYIASAYGLTGVAVAVGSARSTGNAINEPLNSNTATVTVLPLITITSQPGVATVTEGFSTNFSVDAILSDSTFGSLSYQWQLNQQNLSDNDLVQGASGETLTITSSTVGISTVRAIVSNPNAQSVISNNANLNVLSILERKLVNFEYILLSSTSELLQTNLFNGEYIISQQENPGLISFYSPEIDINVEMDLYGGKGTDNGIYLGGEGGFSRIRFTMTRNTEYVISGLSFITKTPFIYRKGSIIATVGAGGNAGTLGKGGFGGGIGVVGESGFGRNAGLGGGAIATGNLPADGIFGSATNLTAISPDTKAVAPNGGRVLPCSRGVYWRQQGVSPCSDVGNTQFRLSNGTLVTNTAFITRGFKAGYEINETAGLESSNGGRGGNGATGGGGGTNGSGGGGGSGYTDGSITVVNTQLGGNTGDSRVVLRLVV
jgi:hypothetical protein